MSGWMDGWMDKEQTDFGEDRL